jgi:hypothetical protein
MPDAIVILFLGSDVVCRKAAHTYLMFASGIGRRARPRPNQLFLKKAEQFTMRTSKKMNPGEALCNGEAYVICPQSFRA